jgi:hypothetical protein
MKKLIIISAILAIAAKFAIAQTIVPVVPFDNQNSFPVSVDCGHSVAYILYLNGDLNDSTRIYSIKKFDGTSLTEVITFNVSNTFTLNVIKYYQGEILVGGQFKNLFNIANTDGIIAYNIAGNNWHNFHNGLKGNLSDNLTATVNDIKLYNGQIIIAGGPLNIDNANMPYNPVVCLEGNEFRNFGNYIFNNGCSISTRVNKLYIDNNNTLFIAGKFNYSESVVLNNVAKIDNNNDWVAVGQDLDYDYYSNALAAYDNKVFATSFISKLDRFDGSNWVNYLDYQNQSVNDMIVYNNNLFIAGSFSNISVNSTQSFYANSFVGFDGSDLAAFNLNPSTINKMFELDGKLYLAGTIDIQNTNNNLNSIARVDGIQMATTGIANENAISSEMRVYPNPAVNFINVDFGNAQISGNITFELFNQAGEKVSSEKINSNDSKISIITSGYATGVYTYRIISDSKVIKTDKVIITK